MMGCACLAKAVLVNASSPRSLAACSVSPALSSQAGVKVRTSQSVASHARVVSSALVVAVPIMSGMNALRRWRPASSRLSFHERPKAPITGDTHCG